MFRRCMCYFWNMLLADKMPVWLLLVGVAASAVATYKFAPQLNAHLETEKIKSAYIQDNLKTLNADTAEFLSLVGDYNRKIVTSQKVDEELLSDIRKRITKLQWKVVEYDLIFDGPSDKATIRRYGESLDGLRKSLIAFQKPDEINAEAAAIAIARQEEFTRVSYEMIKRLSSKMNINLTIEPIYQVR